MFAMIFHNMLGNPNQFSASVSALLIQSSHPGDFS